MTVFKNLSNITTTMGDYYFYGQTVNIEIMASLVMLVVGAILTGWSELNLDYNSLIWLSINCISCSAYLLYIKRVKGINDFGKVFYNSILSYPLIVIMISVFGEYPAFVTDWAQFDLNGFGFYFIFLLNSVCGFAISLSVFWCLQVNSPTTTAMIGAMNKIPLCFLGLFLFGSPITRMGFFYLVFSLFSGLVYVYAKVKQKNEKNQNEKQAGK